MFEKDVRVCKLKLY